MSDWAFAEGRKAGRQLLHEPAGQRPTAVSCANDLLALGLLFEVVHAGLNVPADLSIVGFDDISTASISAVPLTTIQQRRKELGSTAVRLLLDEIDPAQAEWPGDFTGGLLVTCGVDSVGPSRGEY